MKSKVVAVTGGSGGLGQAITGLFSSSGAKVVNLDLEGPSGSIPNCRFEKANIADFSSVRSAIESILTQEGGIDCLINNAGISRDRSIWKMTEGEWDQVLEVNLKGAFNCIHHLASHFRAKRSGKIVNISSINGLRGKFGLSNYSASKAGLIGLTKTVARELGKYNVNVNAVAPGFVKTALTEDLDETFLEEARHETVLGRLATPEDVAQVVVFLCSDQARHITGEVVKVDGGQYI